MDDKSHKEKLEQELRFLQESFEAEVISKEEFEKGKDRIEKKLKEIQKFANEEKKEASQKQEFKQEPIKDTEKKEEAKAEAKTEEKIKLKVIQEDERQYSEPEPIEKKEPVAEKAEIKEEGNKIFKYSVIFIVLLLVVFFSYSFIKSSKEKSEQTETIAQVKSFKTNIIVLNDRKNCFNCDTQRVLSILESWFGELNTKEIDYNTEQGKKLSEKFDAKLLPLYILDENITKKPEFEKFKQTFSKKDNNHLLSDDAAGSTFYFKRDNVPNKLDLFIKSGDDSSIRAEKNLKEFLDTFKEANFEKHSSNDKLTEELNIKTFPTFLVNNRIKFSGIHPPETVKNNFCKLNKLKECEKSLSKSLI